MLVPLSIEEHKSIWLGKKIGTDNYTFNNKLCSLLDTFIIASEKRRVSLFQRANPQMPYIVIVFILRSRAGGQCEVELSFSEYFTEAAARHDFELRRPKIRDASGEAGPMQRGKRLVQETWNELLGPETNG